MDCISPVHLCFDINFMEKSAGGGQLRELLADVDFAFAEKFCTSIRISCPDGHLLIKLLSATIFSLL